MNFNARKSSLQHYCRLCLNNDQRNVGIFTAFDMKNNLQLKVWKHLAIWIKPDDLLPKYICEKCISQLETFHIFSVNVETVQQKMIDMVLSNPPNPEEYGRKIDTVQGQCLDNRRTHHVPPKCSTHPENLANDNIDWENFPSDLNQPSYSSGQQHRADDPYYTDAIFKHFNLVGEEQLSSTRHERGDQGQTLKLECESFLVKILDNNLVSENAKKRQSVDNSDSVENDLPVYVDITSSSPNVDMETVCPLEETKSDCKEDLASKAEYDLVANNSSVDPSLDSNSSSSNSADSRFTDESKSDNNCPLMDNVNQSSESQSIIEDAELDEYPFKWSKDRPLTRKRLDRSKQSQNTRKQLAEFYDYICLECNEEERIKFRNFVCLKQHFHDRHNVVAYIICCKKKMTKRTMLIHHMLTKHLQPEFRCEQCGKVVSSQKILSYHIINHLPESERPFKCSQCSKGFPTKFRLSYHEKIHSTDANGTFICDTCGKRFTREKQLYSHKIYHHGSNDKSVICHICGKTLKNHSTLSKHMSCHLTGKNEKCPHCNKLLKSKETLYVHIREYHNGAQYQCQQCDKSYGSNGRLHSHVSSAHSEVKPYQCSVCNKSFKLKHGLKTHLVQHTGERPYQCPFCQRTFASGANYYTHKKRMHKEQTLVKT